MTGPERAGASRDGRYVVRLILPSAICYLPLVNAVAEEFAREMEFDRDQVECVALSVVEATTNAIQHGNGYDPDKPVELTFQRDGTRLIVTVEDQGEGFDPGAIPDPLAPENLLKESGRGIFICRSFMDEVAFETGRAGGTLIRMVKGGAPEAIRLRPCP